MSPTSALCDGQSWETALWKLKNIKVVMYHKYFKAIINVVIYFEVNCSLEMCKLAFPRNLGK